MSYTHKSWFSENRLKGEKIYRFCKYCGNDNKNIMDCPNCDIGFEDYIYIND